MSSKQRHFSQKHNKGAPHQSTAIIQSMLGTATQHHNAGNLAEAEKLYRHILKIDSKNADSLHLLGLIAHQSGNSDSAINLIKQAIDIKGNVCIYHNNIGNILLEQNNVEEALVHYKYAISIKPEYAEVHNNLGNALRNQGKLKEAIESLKRAINLKPNYADAHLNLGIAYQEAGEADKAIACYNTAIFLSPGLAKAHLNLGVIHQGLGKQSEAAACYKNAIAACPSYADAYNNLGNLLRRSGSFDEAITYYKQAQALNPKLAEVCANMGNTLLNTGKIDDAIEQYEKALTINPDYKEAHFGFAISHFFNTPVFGWNTLCNSFLNKTPLPKTLEHDYRVRQAIYHLILGNIAALEETLCLCKGLSDELVGSSNKDFNNMLNFQKFITSLLAWHKQNMPAKRYEKEITLIGDSHCLSYANMVLDIDGVPHKILSNLILGCKVWRVSIDQDNLYKKVISMIVDKLPMNSKCMFALGEIDCRYNEGILYFQKKYGGNIKEITFKTVKNYVKNVIEIAESRHLNLSFIGVPAPCIDDFLKSFANFSTDDAERVVSVVRFFNEALKYEATSHGCGYVDVYTLTVGPDGKTNGQYHLDEHHLKPDSLSLAMNAAFALPVF